MRLLVLPLKAAEHNSLESSKVLTVLVNPVSYFSYSFFCCLARGVSINASADGTESNAFATICLCKIQTRSVASTQ